MQPVYGSKDVKKTQLQRISYQIQTLFVYCFILVSSSVVLLFTLLSSSCWRRSLLLCDSFHDTGLAIPIGRKKKSISQDLCFNSREDSLALFGLHALHWASHYYSGSGIEENDCPGLYLKFGEGKMLYWRVYRKSLSRRSAINSFLVLDAVPRRERVSGLLT